MALSAPDWRKTLQLVERLSVPRGRRETGLFSLEGHRAMERALRNRAPLERVLVSQSFANSTNARETRILSEVAGAGVPLDVAPDESIRTLTGGRGLGDVFAVMRRPGEPAWEDVFPPGKRSLVLVGWNLGDPGNTGAVIRSALAAGASGFLAVGTTDPWHPKAVRTSMGSLFALPVKHAGGEDWIEVLHSRGVETIASVCRDATPLPLFQTEAPHLALVMGSEAFGLPAGTVERLRRRVTIPMPPGVDSYSINAAAAVLAYSLLQ